MLLDSALAMMSEWGGNAPKNCSSEAATFMCYNSGVKCTYIQLTDVHRGTHCRTQLIHKRGLEGDRKLISNLYLRIGTIFYSYLQV